MNDREFVSAIRTDIIDTNLQIYKDIFAKMESDVSNPYWKEALRFYGSLENPGKEIVFKIIRQVMADTISNLFGILDGVCITREIRFEDLTLELSGQRIDGDLQDLFLEMEEKERAL
jgi:hypothetical protein